MKRPSICAFCDQQAYARCEDCGKTVCRDHVIVLELDVEFDIHNRFGFSTWLSCPECENKEVLIK